MEQESSAFEGTIRLLKVGRGTRFDYLKYSYALTRDLEGLTPHHQLSTNSLKRISKAAVIIVVQSVGDPRL